MKTELKFLLLSLAAPATVAVLLLARPGNLSPAAVAAAAPPDEPATSGPAVGKPPDTRRAALAPAVDAGAFTAPAGTCMTFAFRVRTDFRLCAEDTVEAAPSMACAGSMLVTVLERRPDEFAAEVAFADVVTAVPELRDALTAPVTVRLAADGQVRGYRFAPALRGHHRQMLRDVVAKFRFTIPADAGAAWNADEDDSTGRYQAEYRRLADGADGEVRVERRKLRYVAMASTMTAIPEHAIDGQAVAALSPALGWLTSVSLRESTSMALPSMPARMVVEQTASLQLLAVARGAAATEAIDWDGAWAPPGGGDEDLSEVAAEQESAHWRRHLQGVQLAALVDELRALLAAGAGDAEAVHRCRLEISWLVRLRPEVVAEIGRLVAEGLDADVAGLLLGAAGSAGTAAAQRLLVEVYGNVALGAAVRDAAAFAMLELARPEPGVLQALADDIGRMQAPEPLAVTALLTFGALAGRSAAASDGSHAALDHLLALEDRAGRGGFTPLWLDALGNAGSAATLPAVSRHLHSDDSTVRESAVAALRRVPGEGVLTLLDRAAAADPDATVRVAAVAALGQRPEPDARRALQRVAASDGAEPVRTAALQALAARLELTAGERQLLERIARSDRSPRVRDLAARILRG